MMGKKERFSQGTNRRVAFDCEIEHIVMAKGAFASLGLIKLRIC